MNLETLEDEEVWRIEDKPERSDHMYNFSRFTL